MYYIKIRTACFNTAPLVAMKQGGEEHNELRHYTDKMDPLGTQHCICTVCIIGV